MYESRFTVYWSYYRGNRLPFPRCSIIRKTVWVINDAAQTRLISWSCSLLGIGDEFHPFILSDDRLHEKVRAVVISEKAVWWSQNRPVKDSTESGTATVAVPDL